MTVIEVGPCVVVQRKTLERDGYEAVQIGLVDPKAAKRANKPMRGHHEKAGVPPTRLRREFPLIAVGRRDRDEAGRSGIRRHLQRCQDGRHLGCIERQGLPRRD